MRFAMICDDDGLRCGLVDRCGLSTRDDGMYLGTTKVLLIPTYQFFKYSLKCKEYTRHEFT
jgi:hypothetical protein